MVVMAIAKAVAEGTQGLMSSIDSALDVLSVDTDTSEVCDYTEGVDASDDDMEYNPRPSPFFAGVKRDTLRVLSEYGIDDTFTLRVKSPERISKRTGGDALALYRGLSQFGSSPIFWIRDDFEDEIARLSEEYEREIPPYAVPYTTRINPYAVAVQTLLHEYGHVIYEWARCRDEELLKIIEDGFDNEEEFAEDFMRFVTNDPFCSDAHAQIIRLYTQSLKHQ